MRRRADSALQLIEALWPVRQRTNHHDDSFGDLVEHGAERAVPRTAVCLIGFRHVPW
jgi:hypothetical protein